MTNSFKPQFLKFLWFLLALLVLIFINQQRQTTSTTTNTRPTPSPSLNITPVNKNLLQVKVIRVIDGDTIEIESGPASPSQGGQKVRYIGIDTPEISEFRKSIQCFGKEASIKNKELVEGKQIKMEKDVSETDKFGRLLRYVYVGDIFVNDYLVRQGYAQVSTFPPDVKYQTQFIKAEKEARLNKRGLWEGC